MTSFDVIVAGAGPAGLAAACLVARDGRSVALVSAGDQPVHDPRTVALMHASVRLLENIGVWPGALKGQASPLVRLRLVDDTGGLFRSPTLTFSAAELHRTEFGWNIPLAFLVPALAARAHELGVAFIGSDAKGSHIDGNRIAMTTSAGETLEAAVIIAADGRESTLREAAGIGTNRWSYDQAAIATSFAHTGSHGGMSTEYHRAGGPFTTVPMPGNRSALVWMERRQRAEEVMKLSDEDAATEIQLTTHGELGLISNVGPRRAFSMQGLVARCFAARRTILIGEAAHVVPPIGAQGLNMSLRDAAQAAEIISFADDPGGSEALTEYDALRRRDVQPRLHAIDLMNRSLLADFLPMAAGRMLGLALISSFGPLRQFVMRQGLAPEGSLPLSMRDQGQLHPEPR